MRPTHVFAMHSARITLFARPNCSLCTTAKAVLSNLGKRRSFEYDEIDIMATGQHQWKNIYEFDTPVIHVQRIFHTYAKPNIVTEARKLMHRFTEEEVEALVDEAEGSS